MSRLTSLTVRGDWWMGPLWSIREMTKFYCRHERMGGGNMSLVGMGESEMEKTYGVDEWGRVGTGGDYFKQSLLSEWLGLAGGGGEELGDGIGVESRDDVLGGPQEIDDRRGRLLEGSENRLHLPGLQQRW